MTDSDTFTRRMPADLLGRYQRGDDAELAGDFRSQHDEDRFILSLARPDDPAFVVDVGANDGYSWSNSYLFGKLGCQLLLVEPMPLYANYCRTLYADNPDVRVVEAAIAEEEGEAAFFINDDAQNDLLSMGSSLTRDVVPSNQVSEVRVQTAPLSTVLERNCCPRDYFLLSIDAEGFDPVVVKTAGLDRFRPRIVCVEEAIFGRVIPDMMDAAGYERLTQLGPNGLYRRRES